MTKQEAMREAFEGWSKPFGWAHERQTEKCAFPGSYRSDSTEAAWQGWQAALAWAATQQEPVAWVREWEGDESDANNFIFETDKADLDGSPNWTPLYTHPAPDRPAEVERLRRALSFYADETRYFGPNMPMPEQDEFTQAAGLKAYRLDVTRDHGAIAKAALAKGA